MTRRVFLGLGIATVGIVIALLVGAGSIPPCLGPLEVTPVRCANATGIMPTVGAWVALAVVALVIGALVGIPPRPTRWHALLGGAGLVIGIAWYLVTRPTKLEGSDYDGTWLSLPMPIELDVFAAWATVGALSGLLVASVSLRRTGARRAC